MKNPEENKFNASQVYYNRDTTYILEKKNIKIIKYNKSKLVKHLIETTGLNNLPIAEYDRLILDSTKNEIVYRGG